MKEKGIKIILWVFTLGSCWVLVGYWLGLVVMILRRVYGY